MIRFIAAALFIEDDGAAFSQRRGEIYKCAFHCVNLINANPQECATNSKRLAFSGLKIGDSIDVEALEIWSFKKAVELWLNHLVE